MFRKNNRNFVNLIPMKDGTGNSIIDSLHAIGKDELFIFYKTVN